MRPWVPVWYCRQEGLVGLEMERELSVGTRCQMELLPLKNMHFFATFLPVSICALDLSDLYVPPPVVVRSVERKGQLRRVAAVGTNVDIH